MDQMTPGAQADTTAAIERTLKLRAGIERVWAALVEKEELDRWWGGGSSGSFTLGSEGWFEWPQEGRFAYRVETFEPRTRLAYRWARQPETELDAGESTLVEFTLTPLHGDRTRLDLRESGFRDPQHRAENVGGWDEELADLVTAVEGR